MSEASLDYMDQQLDRARAGEPSAMAALIRAHQRSVYSLALRMLGAKDLAEDLAQDVFMQMSERLMSIESNQHLTFWLRKVTSNKAIDQLRRGKRVQLTSLDDHELAADSVEHRDPLLQKSIGALLAELTPDARAVVLLRYQEDLDPMDIARTLDMSINTVKSHLKRSLDTLRGHFEDESP